MFRFDAIVFDFDGTLVQSREVKAWAFGKLYEDYGDVIVQQVIAYHREHEGISRFIKFRYWHENLFHLPYNEDVGGGLSQSYSRLVYNAVIRAPFVEGALEFLENHYQNLPLFVASGTPEQELRDIIKHRSLNRYFQGIYGSPATKSEILQRIVIENKWSPKKVLMVGDTIADLEGSQNVGTEFIGINEGEDSDLSATKTPLKSLVGLEKYLHLDNA